jgi:serine/threonine-protein kinase
VVLGRFRVVRLLARGGMGEIYLARSEGAAGFAIPVVIKRVLSEFSGDEAIVTMFKREARIMSNLRHPGIVSVLDFGVEGLGYVMVLEYVHGFHVGRWSRWLHSQRTHFPVGRAVHIVLQMLAALEYAHTIKDTDGRPLSVVHRDISPSNVLIDVEGHVKIADFGVARMHGEQTEVRTGQQGSDGTIKGKFPYLAPELFTGASPDAQSDVYSSAVVLDELLRGSNPFRAEDPHLTIGKVFHFVPERLDLVREDVPEALALVVAKALYKAPAERWGSAESFAKALRAAWPTPQEQAQQELADAARRDFQDPLFASTLRLDDLATLARAWRETHDTQLDALDVADPAIPAYAEAATQVPRPVDERTRAAGPAATVDRPPAAPDAPPPQPTPAEAPKSKVVPLALTALAALVVIALAIVGVTFGLRGSTSGTDEGPVYLVVHPTDTADAGPSAPNGPANEVAEPPSGSETLDAGTSPARRRARAARASEAASLEAPFRARAADVTRCFSTYVTDVASLPPFDVRFEVDVDGSVRSASISPATVARLPLGGCILQVARSTHFGPRSEPISFFMPLGARRTAP